MSSSSSIHDHSQQRFDFPTNRSPLRNPSLDTQSHILTAFAVFVPILFIFILCLTIACIYRYKKRRAQQNSSMTPIDQHNAAVATILHNSSRNPFVVEELPPSYDLISETKKDRQYLTGNNHTNEQFHLSQIKNGLDMTPPPPPPYHSQILDPSQYISNT